jgi:hypothetical protein
VTAAKLTGDNGDPLTDKEAAAILAIRRVARNWPQTLTLVSMGGGLHVIHGDDPRYHDLLSHLRGEAVLATIHGIPNDGGDW